jgi:hypothetical protein
MEATKRIRPVEPKGRASHKVVTAVGVAIVLALITPYAAAAILTSSGAGSYAKGSAVSPSVICCGGGGGGGGCSETYNLVIKVTGGVGTVQVEGYNGTGGPALYGPYIDNQKLVLCIGANYGISPLPYCNYVFEKWTVSKIRLFTEDGLQLFTNVSKLAAGATATLTLTLVQGTYAHFSVFVTGGEGTVSAWDPENQTWLQFANGTAACLPLNQAITLQANEAPGWSFSQWYIPGVSLGSGFNPFFWDVSITLPASPYSLALILTAPPTLGVFNAVSNFPWSGYVAPYSSVAAVNGTFTVPSVSFNSPGPANIGADILQESVGMGLFAGLGSVSYQAGIAEYIDPNNPQTVGYYAFATEYDNGTGTYPLAYCWLSRGLYNNGLPPWVPPGCSPGGYEVGALPSTPSAGTSVTVRLTDVYRAGFCSAGVGLTASLAWGTSSISQTWCLSVAAGWNYQSTLESPYPGTADWVLSVPTYTDYNASTQLDSWIGGPTVSTPSTFSGESAQIGSPAVWKSLASYAPLENQTGGWAWYDFANSQTYWFSFLNSPLSQSGSFTVPTQIDSTCVTCSNFNLYETIAPPWSPVSSGVTYGYSNAFNCNPPVTGASTSTSSGSVNEWANVGNTEGICGFYVDSTAGENVGQITPSATGNFEFVFTWNVQWQASISLQCYPPSDPFVPTALAFAGGNLSLAVVSGGWNVSSSGQQLGQTADTFASEGSPWPCVSAGSWSGSQSIVSESSATLYAGYTYSFYSQLSGYAHGTVTDIGDDGYVAESYSFSSGSGVESYLESVQVYASFIPNLPGT